MRDDYFDVHMTTYHHEIYGIDNLCYSLYIEFSLVQFCIPHEHFNRKCF